MTVAVTVIVLWIWCVSEKNGCRLFKTVLVKWRCDRALQAYIQQEQIDGSILSNDWLTAQFYFSYDPSKTPGPYVFINLVGSNDPVVAKHVQMINAAGIFGPALPTSACTNSFMAESYYDAWRKSAYANNILAMIHFQQGDAKLAMQDIRQAALLVNSDFPASGLYSNRYQGLCALAWLVINATNDQQHYVASQQFIDLVDLKDVEPYGAVIVDRISLLSLYLDSLADVSRIRLYGANGITQNYHLAHHYLSRYQQACHSQNLSAMCDKDLLK